MNKLLVMLFLFTITCDLIDPGYLHSLNIDGYLFSISDSSLINGAEVISVLSHKDGLEPENEERDTTKLGYYSISFHAWNEDELTKNVTEYLFTMKIKYKGKSMDTIISGMSLQNIPDRYSTWNQLSFPNLFIDTL